MEGTAKWFCNRCRIPRIGDEPLGFNSSALLQIEVIMTKEEIRNELLGFLLIVAIVSIFVIVL